MRKTTSNKFISMIWMNVIMSCQCDYEGVTWTSRRVKSPSSSLFVQHRKHQSTTLLALWEGNPPVKCCGRKPPRYFSSRMRRGPINTEISRLHITPQSAVRMLGDRAIFQVGFAGDVRPRLHDDVIKWKHFPRYWPPLCGEFTGHRWIPPTKSSDAELWCFLWSAPEQTIE